MSRYFPSMKKHSWIILVCTVLGLIIGGAVAKAQPPAYLVSATLLVRDVPSFEYGTSQFGKAQASTSQTDNTTQPVTSSARADEVIMAINDLSEIATRSFMDYVSRSDPKLKAHHITVDYLMLNVAATTPAPTSSSIILTVTGTSPSNAVLMANDVANGFVAYKNKQVQAQLAGVRSYLQNLYSQYKTQSDQLEKQILAYNNPSDPHISLLTADRNGLLKDMDTTEAQLVQLPFSAQAGIFVVQPPNIATVIPSYKPPLYFGVIAAAGLLVGLLLWLLLIFLDYRLQTGDQVPEKLGVSYLGALSKNTQISPGAIPTTGLAAQQLADIGVNLRLTGVLPGQRHAPEGAVLLITSAQPEEGKTTLATGLAAAVAHAGNSVLVVDGNLREPATHLAFGQAASGLGLSDLLRVSSGGNLDAAVQRSNIPNVWLLSGGAAVDDPTSLIEQRMPAILAQLRKKADWIIIDGPSLLSNADAGLLASMSDGVALVANRDKISVLLRARAVLKSLQHLPVGIIMNRIPIRKHNAYYAATYEENKDSAKEDALALT